MSLKGEGLRSQNVTEKIAINRKYVPLNICPFTLGKRFKARRDIVNLTRHIFTPHEVCLSLLSVPGI